MSIKHPLVGKKLVSVNPQRGEVTQTQIKDTLEGAQIEKPESWLFVAGSQRWTVTVDKNNIITDVTRN